MPELIVTVGLPGSGKSTHVRHLLATQLADGVRAARVNRDALRDQIHPGMYLGNETEKAVTAAQHAQINALLSEGYHVYVDDTNLRARHLRALRDLAAVAGAEFQVIDFTDVPLDTCIERDALRPDVADNGGRRDGARVGEDVIRGMFDRFLKGGRNPAREIRTVTNAVGSMAVPYVPPVGKPEAIMVDLDGTVALLNGRSPYDETCVLNDLPNEPVIDVVRMAYEAGVEVVFMSGRTSGCRADTEAWLAEHLPGWRIPGRPMWSGLFMRAAGDTRPDNVVKLELFDRHVRDNYRIAYVLDDRDQVVRAWRSIGLPTFQVAEGKF